MRSLIIRLISGERGQGLILGVILLAALLGFTGLVVDGGLAYMGRRSTQNAADAAALAAAGVLTNSGTTAEGRQAAEQWAEDNGYSDDADTNVTVNIPPQSGPNAGASGYVEVIIEDQPRAFFMSVFGRDFWDVSSRAVARYSATTVAYPIAMLSLSDTACPGFSHTGGGDIIITEASIMVNSDCDPSLTRTGAGAVSAAAINYHYQGSYSGTFTPVPVPVTARVEDPFASLTPPDLTALGQSPDSGGTPTDPKQKSVNGTVTLRPGVYYGGLKLTGNGTKTLEPGTYVMAGGGLEFSGSGSITGSGVMIYNTYDPQQNSGKGACDSIRLTGGESFTLSGPTSGDYKDIVFWQDDACTNDFFMAGGGTGASGIYYVPTAKIRFTGGKTLSAVQLIADRFEMTGAVDVNITGIPYLSTTMTSSPRLTE
jgi:hypothetical protein